MVLLPALALPKRKRSSTGTARVSPPVFSTPEIESTILRRTKHDPSGKHPWKVETTEGEVAKSITDAWLSTVYELAYTTTTGSGN